MKTKHVLSAWSGVLLLVCGGLTAFADSPPASEKSKPCYQCNGQGKTKCTASDCKDGQADCPGPCLKLSKGVWEHLEVEGHGPDELWQKFTAENGKWQAWNQNHVGEVIETQNGNPVNVGKCPTCGGTARVKCSVCKGTGEAVCSLCGGRKILPESWTAFDNPKLKIRPSRFKLKDGRVLVGRKLIVFGKRVTIHTEKGDVEVNAADIVAEEKPEAQK